MLHRTPHSGVEIAGTWSDCGDELTANLRLQDGFPEEPRSVLEWCLSQDRSSLLSVLASLVASTIDLSHEDASPADAQRQDVSDALAAALDLDMNHHWAPSLEFWVRLSKTRLLQAYEQAPAMQTLSERARTEKLAAAAKLKKDALAQRVHVAWQGHGYLPELLITPLGSGTLAICSGALEAAE